MQDLQLERAILEAPKMVCRDVEMVEGLPLPRIFRYSSSSTNRRRLWQTVNKLGYYNYILHRKSASPLPIPPPYPFLLQIDLLLSSLITFPNYISLFLLILPWHLRTVLLHQLHLMISPLLGLHLNLKFQRSFSFATEKDL